MTTGLQRGEPGYVDRLTDCIRDLLPELSGLIDKALAAGWQKEEIANALAFFAVMQQWKLKDEPETPLAGAMANLDNFH